MGFVLKSINLFLDSHTQITRLYTKRFQPFVILLTLEFKLFIFTATSCSSQYFSFSGLFFVCESDLFLLRLVFDKRPSLLASAIDPAESVNTPESWLTDPTSTISKKLDRWCTCLSASMSVCFTCPKARVLQTHRKHSSPTPGLLIIS